MTEKKAWKRPSFISSVSKKQEGESITRTPCSNSVDTKHILDKGESPLHIDINVVLHFRKMSQQEDGHRSNNTSETTLHLPFPSSSQSGLHVSMYKNANTPRRPKRRKARTLVPKANTKEHAVLINSTPRLSFSLSNKKSNIISRVDSRKYISKDEFGWLFRKRKQSKQFPLLFYWTWLAHKNLGITLKVADDELEYEDEIFLTRHRNRIDANLPISSDDDVISHKYLDKGYFSSTLSDGQETQFDLRTISDCDNSIAENNSREESITEVVEKQIQGGTALKDANLEPVENIQMHDSQDEIHRVLRHDEADQTSNFEAPSINQALSSKDIEIVFDYERKEVTSSRDNQGIASFVDDGFKTQQTVKEDLTQDNAVVLDENRECLASTHKQVLFNSAPNRSDLISPSSNVVSTKEQPCKNDKTSESEAGQSSDHFKVDSHYETQNTPTIGDVPPEMQLSDTLAKRKHLTSSQVETSKSESHMLGSDESEEFCGQSNNNEVDLLDTQQAPSNDVAVRYIGSIPNGHRDHGYSCSDESLEEGCRMLSASERRRCHELPANVEFGNVSPASDASTQEIVNYKDENLLASGCGVKQSLGHLEGTRVIDEEQCYEFTTSKVGDNNSIVIDLGSEAQNKTSALYIAGGNSLANSQRLAEVISETGFPLSLEDSSSIFRQRRNEQFALTSNILLSNWNSMHLKHLHCKQFPLLPYWTWLAHKNLGLEVTCADNSRYENDLFYTDSEDEVDETAVSPIFASDIEIEIDNGDSNQLEPSATDGVSDQRKTNKETTEDSDTLSNSRNATSVGESFGSDIPGLSSDSQQNAIKSLGDGLNYEYSQDLFETEAGDLDARDGTVVNNDKAQLLSAQSSRESSPSDNISIKEEQPGDTVQAKSKESKNYKTDPRYRTCNICNYTLSKRSNLKRHLQTHTLEKPHKCNKCSECFSRLDTLKRHVVRHRIERRVYRCTHCRFKCKFRRTLAAHTYLKHRTSNTSESADLEQPEGWAHLDSDMDVPHASSHINTPIRARYYKCDACDYTTYNRDYFIRHLGVHTEQTCYKCNKCSAVFARNDILKRHLNQHRLQIRGRPFKCAHCPFKFSCRKGLIAHLRWRHMNSRASGKARYECANCDFGTINKKFMIQHSRKHLPKNVQERYGYVYKCAHCKFRHVHKASLAIHLRRHRLPRVGS